MQPSMHIKNMSWFTSESTFLVAFPCQSGVKSRDTENMSSVRVSPDKCAMACDDGISEGPGVDRHFGAKPKPSIKPHGRK